MVEAKPVSHIYIFSYLSKENFKIIIIRRRNEIFTPDYNFAKSRCVQLAANLPSLPKYQNLHLRANFCLDAHPRFVIS